ncbi:ATP-binding protein [Paraconexibacter antarcticus]|uniref:ATP-binding protein n=1 Tax=Paraconexibacter antarcticus TaxID=2949664 RepID=A0ABY5DRJ5_9ACTN|nr:ATP-binding protein [Paraconexibacter antarcticus]UTI63372.1 ATP-binding protein [Paraconexibacter antarcticus]
MTDARIRPRDRDAILQSLSAGVVPRRGQQHIQVGRAPEVTALLTDLERITDGGSAVRFVIGEYGAGKSFFLQLVRAIALEKNLVTMHADLTPDRRLHATGGQARTLYAELTRNLATRTSPEGGALGAVVERFITSALQQAKTEERPVEAIIEARLSSLSELVGGYDFAAVIGAYWRGHDTGDAALTAAAVRWLRGEYTTKTEARADLGVRAIVDDANVYDHLKLLARFVTHAGYSGLVIVLDEMVNLYKLASTTARRSNYEQILRIVNDCLQGGVEHVGFLMGGTPEFLTDTRRGLYSYEALESRLAENAFADGNLRDLSGPVLRLAALTPEELYVLLTKLRHVQAGGDSSAYLVPDEALEGFMRHCAGRLGEAYFRTPRTTIKAFVQLLAVMDQNADADWRVLLGQVQVEADAGPDPLLVEPAGDLDGPGNDDEELTSFQL